MPSGVVKPSRFNKPSLITTISLAEGLGNILKNVRFYCLNVLFTTTNKSSVLG
jgi:hypothetical protein